MDMNCEIVGEVVHDIAHLDINRPRLIWRLLAR